MKREYAKPSLAIESFQLDAAIAGTCAQSGAMLLNLKLESCTLNDEFDQAGNLTDYGDLLFGANVCAQDYHTVADYCYHNAIYAQYLES